MEKKAQPSLTNRQYMKIDACSLSKEDIHKLLDILQERNDNAKEYEIKFVKDALKQLDTQEEDKKELNEEDIKKLEEGFELKVTIVGTDNQELYGSVDEVFSSTNFPDQVLSVYVNSKIPLEAGQNYFIKNSFELSLDFRKQPVLNLSIMVSSPTPNNSYFVASGYDATWVDGIFNAVNNFFKKKSKAGSWIHQSNVYDILLLIISIPVGFWACFKLSTLINKFASFSVFIKSALYVYIFFITLHFFHFAFRYARWIWPLVEYKSADDKSSKHRKILGAIILGLVGTIIWDIIKAF